MKNFGGFLKFYKGHARRHGFSDPLFLKFCFGSRHCEHSEANQPLPSCHCEQLFYSCHCERPAGARQSTPSPIIEKLSPAIAPSPAIAFPLVIASEAKQSRETNKWIAAVGQSLLRNDRRELPRSLTLPRNDRKAAFSLVEMLMALLVASLLLAALAPVITKRMTDNVHVTGSYNPAGAVKKTLELEFGSQDCSDIKTASDGSQYCEGEFQVPAGYNGMLKVVAVGAGGGGAAASTAGYTEYTTVGETNTFNVPYVVNEIEATLISGGSGGGAGGHVTENASFMTADGKFSWTPADITVGKYVNVTGCGGGGGGAGQRNISPSGLINAGTGGGGGSGAYGSTVLQVANKNPWEIHIGGGGGGGGAFNCVAPGKGGYYAGGGGGGGTNGTNVCHGLGGGAGTASGGTAGGSCQTCDDTLSSRVGQSASPTGGGAGGAGTTATGVGRQNKAPAGGSGGSIAGGGGGGGTRGSAGGGGGGGPTRLIINNVLAAIWPGGGGGGGHTGCNTNNGTESQCYLSGAGGGGGGAGGGKGGDVTDTIWSNNPSFRMGNPGLGGYSSAFRTKADGSGSRGGVINVTNYAFDGNCCHGGDSFSSLGDVALGQNGKHGALKISYLDYGYSGGGGGGAAMVPLRKVSVTSGETLKIKVGRGGKGGTKGYMKEDGTIVQPRLGEDSSNNTSEGNCNVSRISRNSTGEIILTTSFSSNYAGPVSGSINGYGRPYSYSGAINNGHPTQPNANAPVSVKGFSNVHGIIGGIKTAGGNGGTATSPFTGTCTGGKGGTEASPNGTNASGYGCGGGGGYSYYGDGGAGSGGYARISWNKYYNPDKGAYELANNSAGGGGASGNVFTYSISVKSNEILTYRIGKGGGGGNGTFASSSNTADLKKLNGIKGGDTVFAFGTSKQITAGGGGGGLYPSINAGNNSIVNGTGGGISNTCTYNGKSYFNNAVYCTKGMAGNPAEGNTGGAGANFKSFTAKLVDSAGKEIEKIISGTGGAGGIAGESSHGGHSENSYGAGGGGAGLWDLGEVSSSGSANPSKGGNGSNGKIILEWWVVAE